MSHPALDNRTPFALAPLFQVDEQGRPIVSALVKGTFTWDARGRVSRAAKQLPWNPTGTYRGKPGESSVLHEPEVAPWKAATDVALIAHAVTEHPEDTRVDVMLELGSIGRHVVVHGDRYFQKRWLGIAISEPQAFDRIPLSWENAFGGWDRTFDEPEQQGYEPRNPLGAGFRLKNSPWIEEVRLPNLEDPAHPVRAWGKPVVPAGVGFTTPDMMPRRALAGTCDAQWQETRSPLLPTDFDRRFFSAAAGGMVADGYLRGDEQVLIRGVNRAGVLDFTLPGVPPPTVTLAFRHGREDVQQDTVLDTVIIDVDDERLVLLWRTLITLDQGPHEVSDLVVRDSAPLPAITVAADSPT